MFASWIRQCAKTSVVAYMLYYAAADQGATPRSPPLPTQKKLDFFFFSGDKCKIPFLSHLPLEGSRSPFHILKHGSARFRYCTRQTPCKRYEHSTIPLKVRSTGYSGGSKGVPGTRPLWSKFFHKQFPVNKCTQL